MSQELHESCATCLYVFSQEPEGVRVRRKIVRCRRNPPIQLAVTKHGRTRHQVGWPEVLLTDWCGDYARLT